MRRAAGAVECLDGPVPAADLEASLADIDRLNAWFGGYRLTLDAVNGVVGRGPGRVPLVVSDIGGGRGDLAARLVVACRSTRRPIRVIVIDREAATLRLARRHHGALPEIRLVQADAAALPLRTGSVHVATSALLLHHLEPAAASASLAEMRRVARLGVVVNDLDRSPLALGLVWLATRLFAHHPFSRHDGPLSVRRAYSRSELRALAARAGLRGLTVRRAALLGRVVAVAA